MGAVSLTQAVLNEMDADDEILTAYHEAGHAVIGYVLGGQVDSVQLWGEADEVLPERFGDCRISWRPLGPSCTGASGDWQRQREILTVLAGPVAEMVYRGEPFHPAHFGPWQHDWRQAIMLGESLRADLRQRTQLLERMVVSLHGIVRTDACWAAIAAVADELAAHEFLDREQLQDVIGFWIRQIDRQAGG